MSSPSNKPIEGAQIDPSAALQYFRQAAASNASYTLQGMGIYNNAMKQARQEIEKGYQEAISTLRPASQAGLQATNEMMRFMGLDPIQATVGMQDRLSTLGLANQAEIGNLMAQAQQEQDPARRAQLKQQVNDALSKAQFQDTGKAALSALGPAPTMPSISTPMKSVINPKTGQVEQVVDQTMLNTITADAAATYQQQLAQYNQQKKMLTEDVKSQQQKAEQAKQQFLNEFNQTYAPEYDKAYTGEQVTQKLQATPGYQFQVDQGTKAIERQGAAAGMLGSGNTLAALQQFGQNTALSFYQQNLQNLSNIAQMGSGATTNIAQLQAGKGSDLATSYTNQGQNALSSYANIGANYAQSQGASAGLLYNAANFNAGTLYNTQQAMLGRQAAVTQQGIASGPSYGALGLQAAQTAGRGAFGQQLTAGNNNQSAPQFAASDFNQYNQSNSLKV